MTFKATTMKQIDPKDVSQHNTPESCWVALRGTVYDVTTLLQSHPGGPTAILKHAGKDATEDFDMIHPSGTLEEHVSPSLIRGSVDTVALKALGSAPIPNNTDKHTGAQPVNLQALLNLDDVKEVAKKNLSDKAWAYYASAGDDHISKTFNNTVYRQILLRPPVFVNCKKVDTSSTLLGHPTRLPIFISPAALARLGHPTGEHGIAEACGRVGVVQIISNNASMSPEEIVRGAPDGQVFGWQLYIQQDRGKTEAMLKRINALGDWIKFIVLTLDAPVPGKREMDERQQFVDPSIVSVAVGGSNEKGGMGKQLIAGTAKDLTWGETLPWLAERTSLPLVLKGIQRHEDAEIATRYVPQVRGILLSNHGGRALDTAPPAVHTLLEIRRWCPWVLDTLEVWVDGGIRRGTDVVKALCLGAKAVGIGRSALFGLGVGGPGGVERVIEILQGELETCMRLLGAQSVQEFGPHMVNSRVVEQDIYEGVDDVVVGGGGGKITVRL